MPREQEALSFKGAKVLFCCGQCKKIFEKSPEKFSANAHHQLVASAQARQEKCPLCGGTTSPECVCELGGVKVQLCSKGCQEKLARAKPAEQVEMLFGEKAFQRGFVLVKK